MASTVSILDTLNLKDYDDLCTSLGSGKITVASVMKLINKKKESTPDIDIKTTSTTIRKNSKNDILVEGMEEIKSSLSNCCKPVPGDTIIGYITKGSGITIHRTNCKNIIDVDERLINVRWNDTGTKKFATDIYIYTNSSDNLVDIINKASTNNIVIDSMTTINKSEYKAYMMTILVENKEKLDKFCNDLYALSFIIRVERMIN